MRKRLALSVLALIFGLAAATAHAQPSLPPCCQNGQTAVAPPVVPRTAPVPDGQSTSRERLAADQAELSSLMSTSAPDMEKAKALMSRIVETRVALGVADARTAPRAAYGCPYAAGPAARTAPYGCPYAIAESGDQGARQPYPGSAAPANPANPEVQGAALPPCCQ